MRIRPVTDLERFLELIDRCEGKVELVTKDGDRYNLKSRLSQLVALTKLLSYQGLSECGSLDSGSAEDGMLEGILDAKIVASDPEEEKMIIAFLKNDN